MDRDDHQCRSCGMSNEAHKEEFGRELEVHHLTPVREYETATNAHELENLETACISCHRRYEGLPIFPK
ncbi:HNH endonuclease [Cryptosporangium minutisporangium]|uniref:HNH endonuclease n=1 Tax=Cryptosporangium minutisporangium TaxID=113569 RepID=UPI0035EED15A